MMSGSVHGGQQPIAGASVMLMVPNTTQYGGSASVLASTSTSADGTFTLPSYTCPANSGLVYLLAAGGDPGSGANTALAEAAVLGPCNLLTSTTFIHLNEVTTVAAAYALAPFASVTASATGIGAPLSNLQGLTNAFGPANNLVRSSEWAGPDADRDYWFGAAAGGAQYACEYSCQLCEFGWSDYSYDPVWNVVWGSDSCRRCGACRHVPGCARHRAQPNVRALYSLSSASAPFQPTLSAVPTDFAVGIRYNGGSISGSYGTQGMAIDSQGKAWIATGDGAVNLGNVHALTEITPAGVYQSGTAGYGSSALVSPQGLAIDANSNVYVTDVYPNTIVKFASNGSLISTFAPTSLAVPLGIAIDTDNTLWVASSRSVSHITAGGVDATEAHLPLCRMGLISR